MAVTDLPLEPWPVIWPANIDDDISIENATDQIMAASEILWWLTGRRYGQYQRKFRPCRKPKMAWPLTWWPGTSLFAPPTMWPLLRDYPMSALCGAHQADDCSCVMLQQTILPGMTQDIVEMRIDGNIMDPSTYRLDDRGRKLVRTDGGEFPWCQDLERDDTQQGTWSVTILMGLPIPRMGQRACGELAAEFFKYDNGSNKCKLPTRMQTITRQGLSVVTLDPQEFLKDGGVGLYNCDLFINAVNPHKLKMHSKVFSPDVPNDRYVDGGPF